MARDSRQAVKEPHKKRKMLVTRNERVARWLEDDAAREKHPLRAFALRHIANMNRVWGLELRGYADNEIMNAISAVKTIAFRYERGKR